MPGLLQRCDKVLHVLKALQLVPKPCTRQAISSQGFSWLRSDGTGLRLAFLLGPGDRLLCFLIGAVEDRDGEALLCNIQGQVLQQSSFQLCCRPFVAEPERDASSTNLAHDGQADQSHIGGHRFLMRSVI